MWKRDGEYLDIKVLSVCLCVCEHVHPFPGVLSSSLLPFMKGEVQREQQMSKHWPLWWQRLRLELKEMLSCCSPPTPQSSNPMSSHRGTHTDFATLVAALTYKLTMAMIQVTRSVHHLRIPQSLKLPASTQSCENLQSVWRVGVTSREGGLYRSHRHSTKANVPLPDIFRGICSHAYSSLLFWRFMHIHYFTWLKYPPKPVVSLRVQIQLVWSSDDGPFKAPHTPVDSLSSLSCFSIQPVCVSLSQGNSRRRHPRG